MHWTHESRVTSHQSFTPMKYAIFTVSTPEFTPEEAVIELKDAGYDGIEWRVTDDPLMSGNGRTVGRAWRQHRFLVGQPLHDFTYVA